jgi:hypothetical protein
LETEPGDGRQVKSVARSRVEAPEKKPTAPPIIFLLQHSSAPDFWLLDSLASLRTSDISVGDRGGLPGWKKDEWRKQVVGVSLVPPEKRPRTKDEDEDEKEEDWDMTLEPGESLVILKLSSGRQRLMSR